MIYNVFEMRVSLPFVIPFLTVLSACTTAVRPIPDAWLSLPAVEAFPPVEFASDGTVRPVSGPRRAAASEVELVRDGEGVKLISGATVVTPVFSDIESFDVSQSRREVAFSARREKTGLDIGLVTLEGSAVSWVPEDPADEVGVTWAPRGNKISYFVRAAGGDLVRTVHVPTSVALTVDFPYSVARSLVWDAPAERFAVTLDSVDASTRVETMRYGGEERRLAIPPAVRLKADVVPMGPHAVLLQPENLRYEEGLPLIIWVTDGPRNAWNAARGRLLQQVRAGCVITDRAPDEALWSRLRELRWVNHDRTYIVNGPSGGSSTHAAAIHIVGDPGVPQGRYVRDRNLIRVQPADVESFSAGFIADHLKGATPRGH